MRLQNISIIQYQNISKSPDIMRLWLPLHAFKKQLEYLINNDYQILPIDEAIDCMERKTRLKKPRPIALTFDNGYLDFYEEVLPLLVDHLFPATLLISPQNVEKRITVGENEVCYLTWD
ncbi:MAG: polysaccharide deacetylase family protein, partial [Deltaproteobacteria bacterium]|nr:polysaccharide deacetylase family protein [Deltaproteobacteria bacterium]